VPEALPEAVVRAERAARPEPLAPAVAKLAQAAAEPVEVAAGVRGARLVEVAADRTTVVAVAACLHQQHLSAACLDSQ
jgi:hypothetical protein